eukprot:gene11507-24051_t
MMNSHIFLLCLTSSINILSTVSENQHVRCDQWADEGECVANAAYMLPNCDEACYRVFTDSDIRCGEWATAGECEKNPTFMLTGCAKSCHRLNYNPDGPPKNFYEIVEKDIDGNPFSFDNFRGKVVYAINVASQCGYTASNYEMFRRLKQYKDSGLEILLFPCNQFGGQEPGNEEEVRKFAASQGFEGIIMSKGDVNGVGVRPSFQYFKSRTGKKHISWNFDGKFIIDRTGEVHIADEEDIEAHILSLLEHEEL